MDPNTFQMPNVSGDQFSASGNYTAPPAQPSVVAPSAPPAQLPDYRSPSPVKTILIIVLTLTTLAGFGLFVWLFPQYGDLKANFDDKLAASVAEAKLEIETACSVEIAEAEKIPHRVFSGPEDYGNLSFEYPKTWSVYVEKDASSGTGDFIAYLHPGEIPASPSGRDTIIALTVIIKDQTYEKTITDYERAVEKGAMTVSIRDLTGGIKANVYTGTVKNGLEGIVTVMKIRDKTAILETDSAEVFSADFEKILNSLTFNS